MVLCDLKSAYSDRRVCLFQFMAIESSRSVFSIVKDVQSDYPVSPVLEVLFL